MQPIALQIMLIPNCQTRKVGDFSYSDSNILEGKNHENTTLGDIDYLSDWLISGDRVL